MFAGIQMWVVPAITTRTKNTASPIFINLFIFLSLLSFMGLIPFFVEVNLEGVGRNWKGSKWKKVGRLFGGFFKLFQ